MALNYIWIFFFIIGFIVAVLKTLIVYYNTGYFDGSIFIELSNSTFEMAKQSVTICLGLIGIMSFWLGIMKIGEKGGAVNILTKIVSPFFRQIFPDVPANHPAYGSMMLNITANMLSLDNAATPLGLKAMQDLQTLNNDKTTASNAMIMFLVLNTSGLTIIPVSVIALRAASGSSNPADVVVPILIATFFSTLIGLIAVSIKQRINLLKPIVLFYIGLILAIIIIFIFWTLNHDRNTVQKITGFAGNFIIILIIILFLFLAFKKKVNVYNAFIEGAKEGFNTSVMIIPYLVAMLVAIAFFRTSGAMNYILDGISWFFNLFNIDTEFVKALPVALMKPLSGSGARGLMVETFTTYGADSFVGRLASIFQGSTETTFYTVAVYYGAINVTNTRYTITYGLIADLAGIIASIFVAYIFFS